LANSFKENEDGKLETSTTGHCSEITCDNNCIGKFDLTDSLARVPPAKLPCVSPPSPCTKGGWTPSCSAQETADWGSYTPKYLIGKRTVPVCDGTPVSGKLADGQIEDNCQECSGSDAPAALHLYTDAPTLEPTPSPTTPSPTEAPTPDPTPAPTPCEPLTHDTVTASRSYQNKWDKGLSVVCGTNEAVVSLRSVHNNGKEDRRWRVECAALKGNGATLSGCEWTGYTGFDATWTQPSLNEYRIIAGVESHHDNGSEDRKFRFRHCKVNGVDTPKHSNDGSWQNSHDKKLSVKLAGTQFFAQWTSAHSNGAEDRRFKFNRVTYCLSSGR